MLLNYQQKDGPKFQYDKEGNVFVAEVDEKVLNFSDGNTEPENNIFTVIVGKNGTGKSRLMKSVIEEFIWDKGRNFGFFTERVKVKDIGSADISDGLKCLYRPQNIIAVSTSPFDKFPLEAAHNQYVYLGLRNLESTDLGMAYMTNIFTSLLKSFSEDSNRTGQTSKVLTYLGYKPDLRASYKLVLSKQKISDSINNKDPVATFSKHYLTDYWTSRNDKLRELLALDEESRRPRIERILRVCEEKIFLSGNGDFDVSLTDKGLSLKQSLLGKQNIDDLILLAEMKLIKLESLVLTKTTGSSFSIQDASSGEQSVVISILGIASKISDNSLVCIDEPEVCLHPEWQEKYLELLINTFKDYKGCHFLIATHSPLLVSQLSDKNCYLMKMEDGKAVPAAQVNKKSVDYQLANNFGAPGYKNEYLTRELISILTMFGETGKVDDEAKEKLKKMLLLKSEINNEDPVKKLMEMAQEALRESL